MKRSWAVVVLLQLASFGALAYFGSRFRPLLLASPVLDPTLADYLSLRRGVCVSTGAVVALTLSAIVFWVRAPMTRTTADRVISEALVLAPIAGLSLFWLWLLHGTFW